MRIKTLKRETKVMKSFLGKEWAKVNLEHFGREVDFKEQKIKLVAYEGEKIEGILDAGFQGGVFKVKQLLVAGGKRNQGIGKKLMLEAEKTAKRLKAHKIILNTGKPWKAVAFYQSLGYKITGEDKNHYFHKDFLIFTKFI